MTLNSKGLSEPSKCWRQCKHTIAYLHLGSDEERRDADELQSAFQHVCLCGHEAVKVVLGQIKRFPVKFIYFTHLGEKIQFHEI